MKKVVAGFTTIAVLGVSFISIQGLQSVTSAASDATVSNSQTHPNMNNLVRQSSIVPDRFVLAASKYKVGSKCPRVGKTVRAGDRILVCKKVHSKKKRVWKVKRVIPSKESAGQWSWLVKDKKGNPARWNPCEIVTWSWSNADSNISIMRKAINELSGATGVTFKEVSSKPKVVIQYDDKPSKQGSGVIGLGGLSYIQTSQGKYKAVDGSVDIDNWIKRNSQKLSYQTKYDLFLHELGHVFGLGHVGSDKEIMFYADLGMLKHYANGDRGGLSILGAKSGCVKS